MSLFSPDLVSRPVPSIKHIRTFHPVGQGGFSIERINGYTVVYDCGSISSHNMLENCINHLSICGIADIDILFISHFDKDHVNGIQHLLSRMRVKRVVMPMIPNVLKFSYNVYTGGAYFRIREVLNNNEVEIDEVGSQEEAITYPDNRALWEWVAMSMMDHGQFGMIQAALVNNGVVLNRLEEDPDYVNKCKGIINKSFKAVFGAKGPNAKGLVVLSQHCHGVVIEDCSVYRGCYTLGMLLQEGFSESSCLYVGDGDLRNKQSRDKVASFLQAYRVENQLLLMQLPHHGSQYNIGARFECGFPSKYYFLNDINTKRLRKKINLYNSLTRQNKLLVISDRCSDLVNIITVL